MPCHETDDYQSLKRPLITRLKNNEDGCRLVEERMSEADKMADGIEQIDKSKNESEGALQEDQENNIVKEWPDQKKLKTSKNRMKS